MPKKFDNVYGTHRAKANFLASEVGLRLETRDMTAYASTLGTDVTQADGSVVKVIKAGKVYPANTSGAKGIVFEDCYPNVDGIYLGSLLTGGKVCTNRLEDTITSDAKAAIKGVIFEDHPSVVRPNFGSGELTKLAAPSIAFSSGTASWTGVTNNNGYAFFVNGAKVAEAAKNATSIDLSGVCASGDYVQAVTLGDYVTYENSDFATAVAYA